MTDLTTGQLDKLMEAILHQSQLKTLKLYGNDLSRVNPIFLSTAMMTLSSADLGCTKMMTSQVLEILKLVQTSSEARSLKILKLYDNRLSAIDHVVLAQAAAKLDELDLSDTLDYQKWPLLWSTLEGYQEQGQTFAAAQIVARCQTRWLMPRGRRLHR